MTAATIETHHRKVLEVLAHYQGALSENFIATQVGIRVGPAIDGVMTYLERHGFVQQITIARFWKLTPAGRERLRWPT